MIMMMHKIFRVTLITNEFRISGCFKLPQIYIRVVASSKFIKYSLSFSLLNFFLIVLCKHLKI